MNWFTLLLPLGLMMAASAVPRPGGLRPASMAAAGQPRSPASPGGQEASAQDLDEAEAGVCRFLDGLHQARNTANEAAYLKAFASDAVVLGTDPAERFDLAAYRELLAPVFAAGVPREARLLSRQVCLSGDQRVAWFHERELRVGFGVIRSSGVLLHAAAGWQVVQLHLGVPLPNDRVPALSKMVGGLGAGASARPEVSVGELGKIREALSGFHRAAAEANAEKYLGRLADDATFLGTADDECWSRDALAQIVSPLFEQGQGWVSTPVAQNVFLAPNGSIAWFDESLRNQNYAPTRATGVLRRTAEGWRIAHFNLVFPIPNEQVREFASVPATDR